MIFVALLFTLASVGESGCFELHHDCTSCVGATACRWCQGTGQGECQSSISFADCDDKIHKSAECPAPALPPVQDAVSSWMSNSMEHIGTKTLFGITIPGSHDTLAYDLSATTSEFEECPQIPSEVRHVTDILRNMAITHKLNIKQQLDSGIRHIDFRTIQHDGEWKGVHCVVTYNPISVYLRELTEWMVEHPKEMVVIVVTKHGNPNEEWPDVANLPNLLNHFTSALGDLIINVIENPPETTQINTYIELNKRVLIYMMKASKVDPSGAVMLDATRNNHIYEFPDGILKAAGYVTWLKKYNDQNMHGQDRWNDIPMFTSAPSDALFYTRVVIDKPCPEVFGYLSEWCPPTLQDIGTLTNYYSQRVLEEYYTNGVRTLPNSLMFDAIDQDGTIRTGHDCISGCQRDGDDRVRFARYAMTPTIALLNVPADASGPWVDAMKELRAQYPKDSWCYPKYGRCPDGHMPMDGGGCDGGCDTIMFVSDSIPSSSFAMMKLLMFMPLLGWP